MKDNTYKKRTQKDYSMNFKLSMVQEVEKGYLTYKQAQERKGFQPLYLKNSTPLATICEKPGYFVIKPKKNLLL